MNQKDQLTLLLDLTASLRYLSNCVRVLTVEQNEQTKNTVNGMMAEFDRSWDSAYKTLKNQIDGDAT